MGLGIGSRGMDHWRSLFGKSNIFDVIENAILIAASDCPTEFRSRRARIAEALFSCKTTRCIGCNHVELHVPEQEDGDEKFRREVEGVVSDEGGEKENKANSSTGEATEIVQGVSNYTYDEAEALTEEIEEETQTIGEVFRIKAILANRNDESDSVLFDSLRRLQLMRLSVETLKATEIGKVVNGIRKRNSRQISQLARTLIDEWKIMVDEWVATAPVLEEATPESFNPSYDPACDSDDYEGLPSPPLDEGAFMTTTSIEFSKFFEGMDDEGNPRAVEELNNNKVKPEWNNNKVKPNSRQEHQDRQNKPQESDTRPTRQQDSLYKPPERTACDSRPSCPRPQRNPVSSNGYKSNDLKAQQKPAPAERSKSPDDNALRLKIELAKRKLREGYQEAENVKKQRTIQLMELSDLPKQGFNHKPLHPKQGKLTRNWSNGRR